MSCVGRNRSVIDTAQDQIRTLLYSANDVTMRTDHTWYRAASPSHSNPLVSPTTTSSGSLPNTVTTPTQELPSTVLLTAALSKVLIMILASEMQRDDGQT